MNLLDAAVAALAVLACIGGYRAGLVSRLFSWAGMIGGLALGALVLPSVVDHFGADDASRHFLIATLILLGAAFVGQALGLFIGGRAHLVIPVGGRSIDRFAGAVAGVLSVLVALWLLLPGLETARGQLGEEASGSSIAGFVSDHAPAAPHAWAVLQGLIDEAGFPRVFANGATPDTGPPPAGSGVPKATLDRAVASTVRVEGQACDRIQDGSGFVVANGLIATNAHVVAGTKGLSVVTRSGARVPATVVHFDPDRDLALLRADVRLAPLALGTAGAGDTGAVLGYPGGGPLAVAPFKVFEDSKAAGRDLYDQHATDRQILILSASLRPGDSGAALINPAGQVVGVAFAVASDNPTTAYALDRSELDAALAAPRAGAVGTGPCLS
ncbi:MAG TPA: MarP family serine protease [Acidimicrobiales bacterium]